MATRCADPRCSQLTNRHENTNCRGCGMTPGCAQCASQKGAACKMCRHYFCFRCHDGAFCTRCRDSMTNGFPDQLVYNFSAVKGCVQCQGVLTNEIPYARCACCQSYYCRRCFAAKSCQPCARNGRSICRVCCHLHPRATMYGG